MIINSKGEIDMKIENKKKFFRVPAD